MELEKLGKHCHTCKQLDYLPFKCGDCNNHYCKDHIGNHEGCSIYKETIKNFIECPLNKCKINIDVNRVNEENYLDNIMNDHITSKKCHIKSTLYKCKFCKSKTNIKMTCTNCGKRCCMKHRYPDTHKCITVY